MSDENDKAMTIKQLRDMAKDCYSQIYIVGCYGSRDMVLYHKAINLLASRGWIAEERHNDVVFHKE
jgi:hypothetical protein